jgi:CheY-like chemotaxis protein
MMIRLLLVDDQLLVRQGLKVLLEVQADFAVVGEAENGQEAIAQVSRVCPDVVLMDVRMPELDGVSATQQILQQFPATKVLMLSTFDDDPYVIQALRCGAKGYLLKDISSEVYTVGSWFDRKGDRTSLADPPDDRITASTRPTHPPRAPDSLSDDHWKQQPTNCQDALHHRRNGKESHHAYS